MRKVLFGPDAMITAAGLSSAEVMSAIEDYRSGCRKIDDDALFGEPFVAGRIQDAQEQSLISPPPDIPHDATRLERLFVAVIGDVLARSGVDPAAEDSLLIISSTKGNVELLTSEGAACERVLLGAMAAMIARSTGFQGTPVVISNACISGLSALVVGKRLIEQGKYSNIVVAGGDLLTRFVTTGFHAFRSVSENICRPYDASRDGLTLGEGCAAMLLTTDRDKAVKPYIELSGGAVSGDANHISGPSRTGDGLWIAIRDAMSEARVIPGAIGFVSGHGTGTVYNDEMESKAFALAGLDRTPVCGLKPYFGHTLGASGIVETIVSAHALRLGITPGTLGFEKQGTPHPLDVSPRHRTTDAASCVKTASGFGGCNAAIVLVRTGDDGERHKNTYGSRTSLSGVACFGNEIPQKKSIRKTASVRIAPDGRPFGEMIRARFKSLGSPDLKFFKMDDLAKLGYVAAAELLAGKDIKTEYSSDRIGIILANRSASLESDTKHCALMEQAADEVSPAVFVYTLPNIVAGEISIRHKIQGESTFFIQDALDPAFVEGYASMLLERGYLDAVIYGTCELTGERFETEMTLLETK